MTHLVEEKDPEEYDNEGSMMKSQLRQICSANEKLMSMVKDDENLPEWVQSKVTKATDYIRSVRDYLESEKMEEKTLTPAEIRKREKVAKAIERENPNMPMDKKMAIATATAKRVAEETVNEFHAPGMAPQPKKKPAPSSTKKSLADIQKRANEESNKTILVVNPKSDAAKRGGGVIRIPADKWPDYKRKGYTLAEDESLDEVSMNTLGNYMRKSSADAGKPGASARRQDKRIGGQSMADMKIRKRMGYYSTAKVPASKNESTLADLMRILKK